MGDIPIVLQNTYGGFYEPGRSFPRSIWMSLVSLYESEIESHGSCTERQLASRGRVSKRSARKAIDYFEGGLVCATPPHRGHGFVGVGSISGMSMKHHAYMYDLYVANPSRSLDVYVDKLHKAFGVAITCSTMQRWFMTIGPFKGTMRVTSTFPDSRDSWQSCSLLQNYLDFILSIRDHKRLVFADEKPMKEKDIYLKVRRDVKKGTTPPHRFKSINSSKNRLNILTAVNIKGGSVPPVYSEVLKDLRTNASVFTQFVLGLIILRILQRGDVFIVDNCTVHIKGDNIGLQEELFQNHGILMITLPPYHPDFNPTELVFQTLTTRMSVARTRSESQDKRDFKIRVEEEIKKFTIHDTLAFFNFCGYNY